MYTIVYKVKLKQIKMPKLIKIKEETRIIFTSYDQLSYTDDCEPEILLYIDNTPIGYSKVWLDSEMENREYICINYEIVYLDTLKIFYPE